MIALASWIRNWPHGLGNWPHGFGKWPHGLGNWPHGLGNLLKTNHSWMYKICLFCRQNDTQARSP
jgi:hypothetical protein